MMMACLSSLKRIYVFSENGLNVKECKCMAAKLSQSVGYDNQNKPEYMEINNMHKKKSISNNNINAFTSFKGE